MNPMMTNGAGSKKARPTFVFVVSHAAVILSAALIFFYRSTLYTSHSRQENVAARGGQVMPFDLEQTTHVFQKLDDGGLQKVVAKDPANKKQIALIQSHLKEESEKFRKGDFSDPAKIHGEDMPGLADLKSGGADVIRLPVPRAIDSSPGIPVNADERRKVNMP
jgi:hypothetical protein